MERVESLRQQLEQTLTEARRAVGTATSNVEPLPRPSGLPLFDPGEVTPKLELRPPRLLGRLGADLLRGRARSQLQRQAGDALRELLSGYRRRLGPWLSQTLAELSAAFHAQAGPLRAQLEARASASSVNRTPPAWRPTCGGCRMARMKPVDSVEETIHAFAGLALNPKVIHSLGELLRAGGVPRSPSASLTLDHV